MNIEIMKIRTEKELAKMGYSNEAKFLIEKYWGQVTHLQTARDKALYMTA